jgi:hypothetical protein
MTPYDDSKSACYKTKRRFMMIMMSDSHRSPLALALVVQ